MQIMHISCRFFIYRDLSQADNPISFHLRTVPCGQTSFVYGERGWGPDQRAIPCGCPARAISPLLLLPEPRER
jgi:hypothetical protein